MEKKADGRVAFPGVDDAERRVDYLYTTKEALLAAAAGAAASTSAASKALAAQAKVVAEAKDKVLEALDKDLNTPVALSVIADLAKAGNDVALQVGKLKKDPAGQAAARGLAAAAVAALDGCVAPLGLMQATPEVYAARTRERRMRVRGLEAAAIEAKVKEREAARAAKDFARGDAIRTELAALGVELLDVPGGATTWRVTV
jgi:cysteinyl-tRNA synthetase